ncbi:MAG: uroporphyrinogen decarboxylase family protein [Candidatus Sumerlaeia bacterium]
MPSMRNKVTVIDLHVDEIEERKERIAKARRGEAVDRVPVMVDISDMSFADARGISVEEYLSDPILHAEAQIAGQKWVLENLATDKTGFSVGPQLGAFPSVFGAPMFRNEGHRYWIQPWIKDASDLKKLEAIDIEKTGIQQKIEEWQAIYRDIAEDYPVQFQGGEVFYPLADQGPMLVGAAEDPLTVATDLMGGDAFFMACISDPEFVQELLAILTEKINTVVQKNQAATGYAGEFFVSSDYAPILSPPLYEEFVVPTLLKMKSAMRGPMRLHHCEIPHHIIDIILRDIQPEILNGFKAKSDVVGEMKVMAEKVGDRAYMEPYLDGVVMLHQQYEDIYKDALGAIELFAGHGCRFHLGAMSCDGHPFADLKKLNAVMQASRDYAAGKRLSGG